MSVNTAIICLGANTPDAAERLAGAYRLTASLGTIVESTSPYPTAPEYAGETEPYLNQIIILSTDLGFEELSDRTKAYQTKIRAENRYAPLVNVDIDIVEWNKAIVRPADAAASYYRTGMEILNFTHSR